MDRGSVLSRRPLLYEFLSYHSFFVVLNNMSSNNQEVHTSIDG